MLRQTASLMIFSVMLLTGCAEWVNIPAVPGDAARHDPNLKDVADVEVAALSALMTRFPEPGMTQIILPMGTRDTTYTKVVQSIGQGAVMGDTSATNSLEVMAVRIRVTEAWVDIRRLSASRIPQLYTVYLKNDVISGWYMQRIRPWRGTINEGDHVPAKLQEERALYQSELNQPASPQTIAMPEPGQATTTQTTTTTTTTVSTPDSSTRQPQTTAPTTQTPSRPILSDDVEVQSGIVVEVVD